jgi:short-subunit dehydrogenase
VGLPQPSTSGTALVTGASSGIGAEIARELARRGLHVTLVARRGERLATLAEEIRSDLGAEAEAIACDLSDPAERARLIEAIEGSGRAVEVLVNNAGFGGGGDFATSDTDRKLQMVRLNVEAVVDLSGRVVAGMVRRGRGAIINIASTAAFQPLPGQATYAATKAFVLSLSEAVRTELDGTGVTVTAVCPGPVRTEFVEVAGLGDVEDRTPEMFWMSAADVAGEAVRGAERGKRVVVPGTLNRAGAIAGQHAPRAFALPLVKRIWSRL